MSATRTALLRAICENPEDDTARLVYADWLDEHGDHDRAEFIRLQVGIAAGTVSGDGRAGSEARAAELLGRNQADWWSELPRPPGVEWVSVPTQFSRGLADAVGFRHGKAWRAHAEEVFAAAPVSRLGCGGVFSVRTGRPVLTSPLLGRVSEFTTPPFDPTGAAAFAANPHLTGRLRTVRVGTTREDGDAVAVALARAPGLRNVDSFSCGWVGPAGATALAGSPYLTRLKSLSLHGSSVGDDGVAAVADSPHMAALEYLFLNYSGVGDRGLTALARSEHLNSLQTLYLGGQCPITDAGALALAKSPGLPRLTDLHLWGSQIGESG